MMTRRSRFALFLGAALLLFDGELVNATPGDLDPSLGGTGKVITAIGASDGANAVVIQPDGKILVAGSTTNGISNPADILVIRYNADGTLDSTFNHTGQVTTAIGTGNEVALSMALQNDGKIVVAGYSFGMSQDFAIVRYYPDGDLDSTFAGDGKLTVELGTTNNIDIATAVAVQSDGKIVAAGYTGSSGSDIALFRCNSNGAADGTFGVGGKVTTNLGGTDYAGALVIQSDGKIVVAGSISGTGGTDFALVRYNANGSLDTSFNTTGKVITDIAGGSDGANAIALQPDGKLVAAGYSSTGTNKDFAVVRYNSDGTLDTSFNGTGKASTPIGSGNDEALEVAVQKDGKIILAGYSSNGSDNDFALVRYNPDGTLDSTFGSGGKLTTPVGTGNDSANAMALQSDGRIVAAGTTTSTNTHIALLRYMGDAEITVEYPAGTALVDGVSTLDFGNVVVGQSISHILTIRNVGGANLTGLTTINFDGPNSTEFTVTSSTVGSFISPGASGAITVRFAPNSSGPKAAALHITSNDSDENPFDIVLGGHGFVSNADDDGDGMTNEAEINLASLGFDPLIDNTALRTLLYDNRLGVGLYEAGDMQTLAMDFPVLEKDPNTGHFHLILSVEKSPNLMSWSTLTGFGATYDPNTGRIDMDITPDGSNPQFFRVLGAKP